MFFAEEDLTLHITRGDAGEITVRAVDETTDGGETPYIFKAGEVLRLKIYEKKNCSVVVLQKDYPVVKDTETVTLALTEADTKIGETISKPVDYWYEIELNPFTEPQTIVGYDDDGAKILRLYPEGLDAEVIPPTEEEVGAVDKELSLTSQKAIQNQAVTRAIVQLQSAVEKNDEKSTEGVSVANEKIKTLENELAVERARITNLATLNEGSTTGDAELIDARVGADGVTYPNLGTAIRTQFSKLNNDMAEQKDLIHYERWDISKTEDATLFDKTYLLATPTTFENAKASHNNFFTLLIKVKPNTTYYGFDEYANSQASGRFAGMFQFYDENKNFLSKLTNPVDSITTPDGCYYVAMHNTYVDIATMTTGEYWFTDKKADERKDAMVFGDTIDLSQTNVQAGKGIEINGSTISAVESSSEKEIKLRNFPTLPYKVYENNFGEYLVEDIFTKKAINCQTYYVDSENGLDTNDGLTRETAFKTLKQGLLKYQTANLGSFDGCVIKIIGDAPAFYYNDLYGETLVTKNLFIVAENETKIICGEKLTFTKHATYENVFVSGTLTNTNVTYCLNIAENNEDSFGLYKPMVKVESIEAVNTTPNSYYIANNVVYSSVETTVTLINSYNYWRFNNSSATSDTILYEENLNVIGGTYYSARAVKETDERVLEVAFKNCKCQHNIMGNGVPMPNYDACYMIDVTAGYSKNDLFNYKAQFITDDKLFDTVVVEVNCKGEEAGYYNTTIDGNTNISTAHEGLSILRLNTIGQHSAGPLIADVNGCRTICIDCDVLNLKYSYTPSSVNGCYVFNDASAIKEGLVTLIDCHGYDNRNNFKVLKSLCKTEIRNCDFHDSFECEDLSLFAD